MSECAIACVTRARVPATNAPVWTRTNGQSPPPAGRRLRAAAWAAEAGLREAMPACLRRTRPSADLPPRRKSVLLPSPAHTPRPRRRRASVALRAIVTNQSLTSETIKTPLHITLTCPVLRSAQCALIRQPYSAPHAPHRHETAPARSQLDASHSEDDDCRLTSLDPRARAETACHSLLSPFPVPLA
jgi:hypothetical protein